MILAFKKIVGHELTRIIATDNLTITAFDGIYYLLVDSSPFLTIACALNSRTKEYFHLNSCPLFDLGHGLRIELQYKFSVR